MKDIIIIGAGPAGLTAAIYAVRAGKSVTVIEKNTFGGQMTFSPKIEN
jgi:thioredoxin reductase (NADPH)